MSEYQTPQQSGPAIGHPASGGPIPAQASGDAPLNPYYAPYVKPTRLPYAFTGGDAVYACFALAVGFLCWEWQIGSSLGVFLILVIALIGSFIYLHAKGVRQTPRSLTVFAVCIAGTLPFLLYDGIDINVFLLLFELLACLYWISVSSKTSVETRTGGFILTDLINQVLIVPFSNFFGFFLSLKAASKDSKRGKSVLIGLLGLCITIPLIIGVTSLLISADSNFAYFVKNFSMWVGLEDIGIYLLEILGGIPIACYLFGAVYGNTHGRYTTILTKNQTVKALGNAHRIPRAAVAAPVAALCVIYIVFIAVLGVYLFSAFSGTLPHGFTYAGYARRGFFELCGVATINLFVIAFTYIFAKRAPGEYPKVLRILTGLLCVLTELLILTAVSKMLLYIGAYDLSQLRIYTLWFLILLAVVFAILIIWHIRPFNAGRPIVIAAVCLFLALFLVNTDGVIAKYNVSQYMNGQSETVDVYMLASLSDAALPHLMELRANAADEKVQHEAADAIEIHVERELTKDPKNDFRSWNIQSHIARAS